MSNISKNGGTNGDIELNSIAVVGENGSRGECWKYNVSTQFPITPPNIENGKVVLDVDSPHRGYSLHTTMKNGRVNGISRILNERNIEIASLVFVDGIANGPCKLYDEEGSIFFEGDLKNGYREGEGKEYDEDGNVVFEGVFKEGKRVDIVELKEMKGYWKEMNEENKVLSICKKDEEGNNDGICYFYLNGKINRISEWKNGKEVSILKQFEGDKMIEFVKGVKRYEGGYRDSIKHNYPREGEGEEYGSDGKSVVYHGHYWNGKRQGEGVSYRQGKTVYDGMWINGLTLRAVTWISIILMIASVAVSCLFHLFTGIFFLVLDIVLWIVLLICYSSVFFSKKRNGKDKTLPIKNDKGYNNKLSCLVIWIIVGIVCNVIISVPLSIVAYQLTPRECRGYFFDSTFIVESNSCNDNQYYSFVPFALLKSIEIGDDCFENAGIFKIDKLWFLTSLKIGVNSFTKNKNSYGNDSTRSFSIVNCNKLESIEIGEFSFSDYAGEFEMKNLPKLSTIVMGEIGVDSWNFHELPVFVLEDLPNLQILSLGNHVFDWALTIVLDNLPSLTSINLGYQAFEGDPASTSSLTMRDLPNLESLNSVKSSFMWYHTVTLSNIPNVETVNLPDSFQQVQSKSVTNTHINLRRLLGVCYGNEILIEIIRTCSDWENEESFDIYEGSSSTSSSIFRQGTCYSNTYNICINPVVHTIVMRDSYGDGWSSGSSVTVRYQDQSYTYSGPSASYLSETLQFT